MPGYPASAVSPGMRWSCPASSWRTGAGNARPWTCFPVISNPEKRSRKHSISACSKARNFQSAMQMIRQMEFAIFDLRIHRDYSHESGARIHDTLNAVREQVAVVIRHRRSIVLKTASRTSSAVATRPVTTVTSGQKSFLPMPSRHSRKPVFSAVTPVINFLNASSNRADPGSRWNCSWSSAAASRASMHCCDTVAWRLKLRCPFLPECYCTRIPVAQ